ncbi:MAG: FAD-dependent oxidoreductase [Alphaproteobacteria bacterium]
MQHLFEPLEIAGHRLRNRIVHLATLTQYGERNGVSDRLVDYHAARAAGGAAVSIVEGLAVHPSSVPLRSVVTLFDDANADGLKRLAAAGEDRDCRMIGQLWHVGRQQLWSPIDSPVGVSDQPDAYSWTVPHVLDPDEIADIVAGFVDSARRLRAAGFSGVELHGAHGYLITQFLSPWSNSRDDAYGGDRARRLRFVREIAGGIREACGADFIVGLKMPAQEGVPCGIDLAEAQAITRDLAGDGVLDYFAYSQGNFSQSLDDHTPDMHYRPGHFLDLHKALREAAGNIPVMAVGRVTDAAHAEQVLANGQADLIGLGRALVADPALPNKARDGGAIRPCVFCNLCWGEIHQGKPLLCFLSPALGTPSEVDEAIAPAAAPRRLVVVGAGPAGLETAWRAAARGHRVTLIDGATEPGGTLRLDARLPGRGEMAKAVDYLAGRCVAHGVDMRLGHAADPATIAAEKPDLVVLATGATPRRPELAAGAEAVSWREALLGLLEGGARQGRAVLFDMDHSDPTYAFAHLLTQRFEAVTLLTPRVQIARNVPYTNALGIYRRLLNAGVEIVTTALPVDHRDGRVIWRNAFTGKQSTVDDVALFAYSTPRQANDALAAPLRAAGLEVRLVGDARAPRTLFSAIHEGAKTANEV